MSEYTPDDEDVEETYVAYEERFSAEADPRGNYRRWLAAHDRALREQIEQQMIERAYFHIAWEKGLTIVPAGHGRAKVPPHWVEAATARLTPYLDIIRGEGSE